MIHHGDCVEVMAGMPEASVDAIVTDPPYGLEFMGKEWDRLGLKRGRHVGKDRKFFGTNGDFPAGRAPGFGSQNLNPKCARCGRYEYGPTPEAAAARGRTHHKCMCETPDFRGRSMGPQMQDFHQAWAAEAIRVAKPGAYLLAFGGTRTSHRLACAIEDAGWIIRDTLVWAYASGFPKGRAKLKPAWEPIVMARKPGPLRPLAIDECRIEAELNPKDYDDTRRTSAKFSGVYGEGQQRFTEPREAPAGRWPANVILTDPIFDGDSEGVVGGGETGISRGGNSTQIDVGSGRYNWNSGTRDTEPDGIDPGYGDTGTYSRFFLIPKAARSDREPNEYGKLVGGLANGAEHGTSYQTKVRECGVCGDRTKPPGPNVEWPACGHDEWAWVDVIAKQRANSHPTVKPTELMRHLVRLVTPTGGTVLDPFLGSGTTAIAAEMEGFSWIGIEREAEYVAIAEARLAGVQKGLGLDVPAPTPAPSTAKGHWPKERGKGGDGYGFKGQTGLEERWDSLRSADRGKDWDAA